MTKDDLRAIVAERLGRERMSDFVWDILVYKGHVKDALDIGEGDSGEVGIADLVEIARALRSYEELMEGVQPRKEGSDEPDKREVRGAPIVFEGGALELARARSLGVYLSLRGSLHPLVRRFREEVLGGRSLTDQEVRAFVESPANSRLSPERLKDEDVPIVGHSARFLDHGVVLEGEDDRFVEFDYVYVDPPGDVLVALLPTSVYYDDLEKVRLPTGRERTEAEESCGPGVVVSSHTHVPIYPGSVLDGLARVSSTLSQDLSAAWDRAQAAWFILTDETVLPAVVSGWYVSATGEHLTHGTVTLEVEPWVPAEIVRRCYRDLQAQVLGQKPRAPEERNIAIFEFVASELKASMVRMEDSTKLGKGLSWSKLMMRWNKANASRSSWTYRHASKFRRDYRRGGRAVVEPYDHYDLWEIHERSIP